MTQKELSQEKKLFWKLFEEQKAKGLSGLDAAAAACNTLLLMNLKLQSAEDADFEIVEPLKLTETIPAGANTVTNHE